MKTVRFLILCALFFQGLTTFAQVQWANKVIDFSSEYVDEIGSPFYRAKQALGYPNTPVSAYSLLAWSTKKGQMGNEFITVGFAKAQMVQQVIIGETYNPGTIKEIILYDDKGKDYTIYENKNPGYVEKYGELLTYFKTKPIYNVVKLTLKINTNAVPGMSQIDCIGISSNTQPYQPIINVVKYSEAEGNPENLGAGVNSEYYDHMPLVSPDGKTLYFARKFATENMGKENRDDIYFAKRMPNGQWGKAANIGEPLNNNNNNYVVFISADNQRLYLANHYKKKEGGLSMSTRDKSGKWGKPKEIDIKQYYSYNVFSHFNVNLNENTMLLCLERDDSYGDLDIYVSFKYADGSWSEPQNLGPKINSVGTEGSAFLAADDKTIYFSSSGRQGFGSYDMYMTKRLDNSWMNWSEPINLGDKINTPKMDIYYSIPPQGDYIYYSSENYYYGLNDLYRIKLPKEARPEPVDVNKILANAPLKKESVPNMEQTISDLKNQQNNTIPQPIKTNPTPVYTEVPKQTTPTKPNPEADALQKKLDELKKQQQQPVSTAPIQNTVPQEVPKPLATQQPITPQANPTNEDLQKKLDELKKQQQQPIATIPIQNTVPQEAPKPLVIQEPITPQANPTNEDLQKKLDELKKQQQQPNVIKTTPVATEPQIVHKSEKINVLPMKTEDELLVKPKVEVKPFTPEEIAAQQKIKNNPTNIPANDNINNLSKKDAVVPDISKPEYKNPNTVVPPTVSTPIVQQPKMENQPIYSNQPKIITQEVDPATIEKQAQTPINNEPLKKSAPVEDDLQAKLDELKKQQQGNKINAATNTANYNKPYDPNANSNYYPNPKPVTTTNSATTDALDQKLAELKQQQYQPVQSTRINDPNVKKPYEPTTLKEKQADKASEEYDDFQKKLDALKNQQKQPNVSSPLNQNNTTSQPAVTVNATNNTVPTSPSVAKEPIATSIATPTAKTQETPKTVAVSNPDLAKYEEKLKKLKAEMAEMGMPENTKPTTTSPIAVAPSPQTTTKESEPIKPIENYTSPTTELQKKLDELKKQQEEQSKPIVTQTAEVSTPTSTSISSSTPLEDLTPRPKTNYQMELEKAKLDSLQQAQKNAEKQLADMLDKMGNNKQSLEKDITELKAKVSQFEKNKNDLSQQNTQLADEKKKLEEQKKQMDEMLAQMQAERDRVAMEKVKMEQDKKLLDQLKKQQEKEVLAMKHTIDSLAKIKAKAQYRADSILNLDPSKSPQLDVGTIIIADKVLFMADASYLAINSYPEVDKIATFLIKNKTLKVEIGGHTNGLCDEAFCNKLSTDRAKTIVDYLVTKGIDRNRLTYKGYGKQFLVAPAGSPMNQRVEIKILAIK